MHPPIHIILEYNPSPEFNEEAPNTIRNHQDLLKEHGSVLWPKISKSRRTRLYKEDVPHLNEQIKSRGLETHFYMYAPEHKRYERSLHVARLNHVFLEGDPNIQRNDPRIPPMYHLSENDDLIMYFFELVDAIKEVGVHELDNLLVYPEMTFLDLVSFISPQRVLEATARIFFP